jgi:hypothetical protein
MKRTLWFLGLVVVLVPRARGDESGLALVPAKTPLVLYFHGVDRTKERLLTLIKSAAPDKAADLEKKFESNLKEQMNGRELKGLAKDGPVFLVMMDLPQGEEEKKTSAAIIRVTNYSEFRDGILTDEERKTVKKEEGYETAQLAGNPIYFVNQGDYAIIAIRKDTALYFSKKHDGLDTKLVGDPGKRMLESDLAIYVNMEAVNQKFGEQIQGVKQMIAMFLQQGAGEKMDAKAVGTVKDFIDGFFQFLEDSKAFLVAADFRPEGLALHAATRVGSDSKTDSFLTGSNPAALADIGKFPKGQIMYCGAQFGAGIAKAYEKLIGQVAGDEAKSALTAAGPQGMYMNLSSLTEGIQVWQYEQPSKAVEANIKIFEAAGGGANFQSAPVKGKPQLKRDAESYRDFKFTSVHIDWDFEKMAEQPGAKNMVPVMKKLMGEGLNVWFGTDGKSYIQLTAPTWDAAKKELDAYLDGKEPASGDSEFNAARAQLPAETTFLSVFDGPQYVAMLLDVVGPNLPMPLPPMKAEKGKSYAGVAVTLKPQHGTLDLWLPVSLFKELRKMAEPIMERGEGM